MNRPLATAIAAAAILVAPFALGAQQSLVKENPHGQLNEACTECHTADSWKPAQVSKTFAHAPRRFPLEGAHAQTKCLTCHRTLDFKNTRRECSACHKDVHRGELGADCARCHTPRNFLDRTVMQQLHQTTRFPLSGAHLMADCQSCHAPVAQGHLSFVNLPTQCDGCHMPAYLSTATLGLPHATIGFSTQCDQCHVTVNWQKASYDHSRSGFALTGAHIRAVCTDCHKNNVWSGLATTTCFDCHQTGPNSYATATPTHTAVQFDPTTCAVCHSTSAWAPPSPTWNPATWDHTGMWADYTGAHPSVACNKCHVSAGYGVKGTTCGACHVHHHAGESCTDCHSTTTWDNARGG